jgi:hypothetical protein
MVVERAEEQTISTAKCRGSIDFELAIQHDPANGSGVLQERATVRGTGPY